MAANKIKLGQRPSGFKRTVTFPMLDGTEGMIEMSYRYRTRREFGQLVDETFAGAKPDAAETFSLESVMARTATANSEYILKIADGWNLDEPFGAASLEQLNDEVPAAVAAIMEDYRIAVTEGRRGN